MANLIVNILTGISPSTISSDLVYIDIDMNSADANNKLDGYLQYEYLLQEPGKKNEAISCLNSDELVEDLDKEPKIKHRKLTFLSKDTISYKKAKARFLKKAKYKISTLINVQAILNSLRNIFTWIPGERILNPEFGSQLRKILYEGIVPLTEERIVAEIKHCILEWEPRVSIKTIVNASTVEDTELNIIHIEIIYTIPTLTDDLLYNYPYILRTTIA